MGAVLIRLAEYLRMRPARRRARRAAAAAPDRDRGSPPAAAPAPPGPDAARPRTRWRCSPGCWPRSAPTARAWSSPSRSRPSSSPTSSRTPPSRSCTGCPPPTTAQAVGATMNLTDRPVPVPGHPRPRRGRGVHRRDGLPAAGPDARRHRTRDQRPGRRPRPRAADQPPQRPAAGPRCRAAPCTLRQMRAAQRAAEPDPRITLWAELSVLAHLTGWTMPMPGPGLRRRAGRRWTPGCGTARSPTPSTTPPPPAPPVIAAGSAAPAWPPCHRGDARRPG